VVNDAATGTTAVFLLIRHLTDTMDLTVQLRGLGTSRTLLEASQLHHADLAAINSAAEPDKVSPTQLQGVHIDGERLRVTLQPASWNVIVTRGAAAPA